MIDVEENLDFGLRNLGYSEFKKKAKEKLSRHVSVGRTYFQLLQRDQANHFVLRLPRLYSRDLLWE